MMSWRTGKILVEAPLKEPAEEEYGSPYWHIHRADLHRGLLQAAQDLGVIVEVGCRVVGIEFAAEERVKVKTKNGAMWDADLVIASDGIPPSTPSCLPSESL